MTTPRMTHDVAIIGGGIVGLATARALLRRRPGLAVVVLEKDEGVCRQQTGHNSGVIHTGLYYKPGSLKARLAVAGAARMRELCEVEGLPIEVCGKLVVATTPEELPRLDELHRRAAANGVPGVERVGPERMAELQPGVAGRAALWAPTCAITDFVAVGRRLAEHVEAAGGRVRTGAPAHRALRDRDRGGGAGGAWRIEGPFGDVAARFLVGCAGLHADRVARGAGASPDVRIVPFRGEYLVLAPELAREVRRLVYPVPDPALPFLGVHLTPHLDGSVEAGPNAVLALAREGYRRGAVGPGLLRDARETLGWPGFWRMARRFGPAGLAEEVRSLLPSVLLRDLKRLFPEVEADDLLPGGAGVRAQAVDRAGALLDDFRFEAGPAHLHVLNAPSPAATASLAIGDEIASRVLAGLD